MNMSARLRAVATEQPNTVQFQMLFPAPVDESPSPCALATLETGDGRSEDLGLICAPTADTWATQHTRALITYTYADTGPHIATLMWGEVVAAIVIEARDDDLAILDTYPSLTTFHLAEEPDQPLAVSVRVELAKLREWHRVRVDGGARNVRVWTPHDASQDADAAHAEWRFEYQKPGPYRVYVDLIDGEGYWLARLGEFSFDVTAPVDEPDSAIRPRPPGAGTIPPEVMAPIEVGNFNDNLPPWMPFRYVRPLWAWARTYSQPGGTAVSRYLSLGAYLAIRQVAEVGGEQWYQSTNNDWIPASAVTEVVPSTLKGVELGEKTPPEPPPIPPPPPPDPPPGDVRSGVVIANVLNVRSGPGTHNPVVAQLRYNSQVQIYEESTAAGAVWYRIGTERWVHSGWVRVLESKPPDTPPGATRQGVVTAHVLNVRAQPGVRADNPPIDKPLRGATVTIHEEAVRNGATWYRIGVDRWVHGGWVRLLPSEHQVDSDGASDDAVWQLPAGWVTSTSLNVRARPGVADDNPVIGTVEHNQALSILDTAYVSGQLWYRIGDDRWVYSGSVAVARIRPRPASIRPDELWVGVNLRQQTLVAYEGDRPVYAALTATGMTRTPTVQGIFRTWWRLRSRRMAGGSAATGGYYYLEEVPWTCYFYSGYALHGAYWHDGFGRPRSHGCVNLSLYDSWWIFQWSERGGPNSPAVYVYWE